MVMVGVLLPAGTLGAQESGANITFRARGYSDNNAELLELEINGEVVETFTMSDGFRTYVHPVGSRTTISRLRLNFINDATFGRRHPNNRTIRVDYIEVDGERIQTSDADTKAKGVNGRIGDRCRAEIAGYERERLHCNGYFEYGDAVGLTVGPVVEPPVDDGDYYVSTSGLNSNTGRSPEQAFATIERAIFAASPNDKILVEAGTYRQGEILVYKPVTLQAYGGDVWIKGSADISNGWASSGSQWVYDGWDTNHCRGAAGECSTYPIDYEKNPYAFHPDMLFIDGVPLVEVGSRSELDSDAYDRAGYLGRFYVDQTNARIFVNRDPRGSLVESALRTHAFKIPASGSGTTLDGLNVTHFASGSNWSTGTNASIYVAGKDVSIVNSDIVWNASYGLFINPSGNSGLAGGYVVENNNISMNGMNGAVVRSIHNSRFVSNTFANNNSERWNIDTATEPQTDGTVSSATVAAVKVGGHSSGLIFDNNTFEANASHGWWCDVGCTDVKFTNNVVAENVKSGVFYEISSDAIFANNIISRNGEGGLWVAESNGVKIYNNVIEDNHLYNVWFYEGKRHDAASLGFNNTPTDMAIFEADNVTFGLADIEFGNNVVSSDNSNGVLETSTNNGQAVWWSDVFRADNGGEDGAGSIQDTEGFNAKFDYFDCNPTYRSDSSVPRTLIEWYGRNEVGLPAPGQYESSFTQLNLAEGNSFQSNALLVEDVATNPFYTLDRTSWTFAHVDKPALTGCVVTPAEVTDVLGVPAGLNTAGLVEID